MIKLDVAESGDIKLLHWVKEPSIYLDHWAIRKISEDPELSEKFTVAIKKQNGTLCLSWLSCLEFARVSSSQIQLAEDFIDSMLPNIAFLEVEPFTVIRQEDEIMHGQLGLPPQLDGDFARVLLCGKQTSLNPLSVKCLLEYSTTQQLVERRDALAKAVIDRIAALRSEILVNPRLKSNVKNKFNKVMFKRGTRQIVQEMLRPLLSDCKLPTTENNVFDFLHAVVPTCYCDFVFLDAPWVDKVEKTKTRLSQRGILGFPLATVYSEKNNGILNMLTAFSDWRDESASV